MKKNTLLAIAVIAFVVGIGLGIWGMIKVDCIGGPGCWVGSGFLMWTGGSLIVIGLVGMAAIGGKTSRD